MTAAAFVFSALVVVASCVSSLTAELEHTVAGHLSRTTPSDALAVRVKAAHVVSDLLERLARERRDKVASTSSLPLSSTTDAASHTSLQRAPDRVEPWSCGSTVLSCPTPANASDVHPCAVRALMGLGDRCVVVHAESLASSCSCFP